MHRTKGEMKRIQTEIVLMTCVLKFGLKRKRTRKLQRNERFQDT